MREIARRFNERFGETLVVPELPHPRARRADHGPAGAREQDVDDRRRRGRHRLRARRARRDPQEARQRRHRLGPRGRPRRGEAGDHQPDRHPRGRQRAPTRRRSSASSARPATATSRRRSPRRSSSSWPRSASATPSCAPTRRRSRRRSPPAPRRRARSPRGRSPTCASAWASARGAKLRRMTVAELDLELDVFAGPFDLLLAVVLREEVDLLEVELGEVVVAYVEYLEREGELELEVATEFLVLIASLLELKSRLILPGADDGLEELGPEEAIEELLARLLEYRRYSAASAALVERFEAERGYLYRAAPLPRRAAPGRGRGGHRRLRPRAARRRARRPADAAARGRHQPHPPDRLAGEAARRAARGALAAGPASTSTSSSAARTASPRRSPSSPCSSSTAAARRPGSRASRSARSRSSKKAS